MFSHFILALMKENVLFRFLGTQRTFGSESEGVHVHK